MNFTTKVAKSLTALVHASSCAPPLVFVLVASWLVHLFTKICKKVYFWCTKYTKVHQNGTPSGTPFYIYPLFYNKEQRVLCNILRRSKTRQNIKINTLVLNSCGSILPSMEPASSIIEYQVQEEVVKSTQQLDYSM